MGVWKPKTTRSKSRTVRRGRASIRASIDVTKDTANNVNHWKNADALDANAATNTFKRQKLRDRSRYEVANNTYARGIINTFAKDIVGTGPRLQLQTSDENFNRRTEAAFTIWSNEIRLPEKLLLARQSQAESGEVFLILRNNPKTRNPVTLDIAVIEAEQVANPDFMSIQTDPLFLDGITFDEFGNPVSYDVLKSHPGSDIFGFDPSQFDRISARFVIHLFKKLRPGQNRGIPEITAALPLFAQLRRYTLATISAAETAANNSYVISTQHSNLNPEDIDASAEPFEEVDIARNMATVMPAGWTMGQMKSEQPTTQYAEFKGEILNEIARVIDMPFNIAAANSSGYNYASGRLDHQTYFKGIKVEQSSLSHVALNPIFNSWFFEVARLGNVVGRIPRESLKRTWFFDGFEHVDPQREAKAQDIDLKNFSQTYADVYARRGKDWQDAFQQIKREQDLLQELEMVDNGDRAGVGAKSKPTLRLKRA